MATAFWKVHGLGNDFIYFDLGDRTLDDPLAEHLTKQAIRLCLRREMIGADGVILSAARRSGETTHSSGSSRAIRFVNADGTIAKACGNGTRCAALAFAFLNPVPSSYPVSVELAVDTGRVHQCTVNAPPSLAPPYLASCDVTVDMGTCNNDAAIVPSDQWQRDAASSTSGLHDLDVASPELAAALAILAGANIHVIFVKAVSTGNGHVLIGVASNSLAALTDDVVRRASAEIQNQPRWKPCNVEYPLVDAAWADAPAHIRMRVCEAGAGITSACGSGACATAAAVASWALRAQGSGAVGRSYRTAVEMDGGTLVIDGRIDAVDSHAILMTGQAAIVCEGKVNIA